MQEAPAIALTNQRRTFRLIVGPVNWWWQYRFATIHGIYAVFNIFCAISRILGTALLVVICDVEIVPILKHCLICEAVFAVGFFFPDWFAADFFALVPVTAGGPPFEIFLPIGRIVG